MLRVSTGFLLAFFPTLFAQAAPAKSSGVWLEVPYVKQTKTAALGGHRHASAILERAWHAGRCRACGCHGHPETALFAKGARHFRFGMQRYLRESGFREFAIRGEWSDLRQHLEQGRPLIISIQPGSAKVPLHYVVVTGMDWEREAVFVNDPARGSFCASSGGIRERMASFAKLDAPRGARRGRLILLLFLLALGSSAFARQTRRTPRALPPRKKPSTLNSGKKRRGCRKVLKASLRSWIFFAG